MTLVTRLLEHLHRELPNEFGFEDPFKVICFKPFPEQLYAEIMDNLPGDEYYKPMLHIDAMQKDGSKSSRLVLGLHNDNIMRLPRRQLMFWRELSWALDSPGPAQLFSEYLKVPLPLHAGPLLLRDTSGYRIAPHPDKPTKAITIQAYLAQDDSMRDLGTSFYRKIDDKLEHAVTLAYTPNFAYGFAVSENSWHGTECGTFKGQRDSLMLIYYRQPFKRY